MTKMWVNKKPLLLGLVALFGSLMVLGFTVVRVVDLRQVLNLPQAASTTVTCTVQPVSLSADKKTATIKVWGTDNTVDGRAVRVFLEKSDGTVISPVPTGASLTQIEDGATYKHYFLGSCQVFSDIVSGKCPQNKPLTLTVAGLASGNYVVHCDTSNLKTTDTSHCTGNPFCSINGGKAACSGWKTCSASDSQAFTIGTGTPPAGTITVSGSKIGVTNAQVTLDGGSPTTANPYTFSNLTAGIHRVIVTVPSGYTVKSTACFAGTACHTQACIDKVAPCPVMDAVGTGNNRSFSLKAGQHYEVYWHFTATGTTCNATTCPTGCCANNQCQAGTATTACGTGGAACQTCTTGQTCTNKQCGGTTEKHLECIDNTCVLKDGADKDGAGCTAAGDSCVVDHELK